METKNIIIVGLIALLILAYSMLKNKEVVTEKQKVEIKYLENVKPAKPNIVYSFEYKKGYMDGYTGAWLGPFNYTVSSEYRQGWKMGQKDRKENNPPKFKN